MELAYILLSDEKVIERVLNGRTADFCELVRRHQGSVYRLAYRILQKREEAEDATQEALILVYRNLASYSEQGRFWPWVRRITVNCCLKRVAHQRGHPNESFDQLAESDLGDHDPVEEQVLMKLDLDNVRNAIADLPESYRTVMVLRYQEDLSCKEIADLLGENLSAVQVRLHRARKVLTTRLAVKTQDEM